MFSPKTDRIKLLSEKFSVRISELEKLFLEATNIYIDYANVRPWATKLGWHVDLKRLKQFLDSFSNIQSTKIYRGTLLGDEDSEDTIEELHSRGYVVKTKPVKIMKQSIDVSSIATTSPDLLNKFIRKCLLKKYDLETVEYLNGKFKEMNQNGIFYIEDLKCNFDVEIGRDMLVDYERNHVDTFVLWSGDSDFADPVEQLLGDNKKVVLFATARKVSTELSNLREKGLVIFDIQKIRNFVCWKKEIQPDVLPN
ncbi:NYN domain-containing protein [Patescibacteria group bacterium]|nr:NYN domain-containing protein [Patescibacteria group bacterium]MBU1612897.1 NYN domain-containing protein [Patescibacteria group bacterium]